MLFSDESFPVERTDIVKEVNKIKEKTYTFYLFMPMPMSIKK